jgi:hypothetical protein
MVPVNMLDITQSVDGGAVARINNPNAGVNAAASFQVWNGAHGGAVTMYGANVPQASDTFPNGMRIATDASGGLTLSTSGGNKPVRIAVDGAVKVAVDGYGMAVNYQTPVTQPWASIPNIVFGQGGAISGSTTGPSIALANNVYYDGANYIAIKNLPSTYLLLNSSYAFYTGAVQNVGGVVALKNRMQLFNSGTLSISSDDASQLDLNLPGRLVLGAASGAGAAYVYDGVAASGNNNSCIFSAPSVSGCIANCTVTTSLGAWRFQNPNGVVGMISTAGSATTYATSSDETLKNYDVPQRDFKAMLRAIKVQDAEFTADPGTRRLVISAQQVAGVGYDDCTVAPDLSPDEHTGVRNKNWMADYGRLSPLALWGVQDLYKMIEAQAAQIAAMEAKLAALGG